MFHFNLAFLFRRIFQTLLSFEKNVSDKSCRVRRGTQDGRCWVYDEGKNWRWYEGQLCFFKWNVVFFITYSERTWNFALKLSHTFFMKIYNFWGNLAIKEKMFVFRKENHASICICSWIFLVLRATRNQRRGRDENLIPSGCLIYVSPFASHFRGAWLQWVPSPLTTYQTNITGDVQKRLLQRLGTCAIDAEVKALFFVTFLQELVPLHYICDSACHRELLAL